MLSTVLIVVLVLLLIGALPNWGYSRSWGAFPSGALAVVLLVVLILWFTGNRF
jgi:F0F1-type ATP synthase assembly protein I